MRVLISRKIHTSAKKMLENAGFEVVSFDINKPLDPQYILDNIDKFDGILTCVSERIDRTLMLKTNGRLKIISNMAVGLDNIDLVSANELGILVFNTPVVVTGPTADLTIAMAFALLRKIKQADHFVRNGLWKAWDPEIFLGQNFSSLTWGIVGYGNIGKAVAKQLSGFEMEVLCYDPIERMSDNFAKYTEIDELINRSNVISLHLPLNSDTKDFFNLRKFQLMKKDAILVNMARGGVVNSSDLLEALSQKKIGGAALDVFAPEPIPLGNEILSFDNVLLTPHIGTATVQCRKEMAELAAQNIINNLKL
jgi:lactate dehydrogenase-like 2-hydroxyacid dehydrogenase